MTKEVSDVLTDILSDGEWHRVKDLVSRVYRDITPERAIRRYMVEKKIARAEDIEDKAKSAAIRYGAHRVAQYNVNDLLRKRKTKYEVEGKRNDRRIRLLKEKPDGEAAVSEKVDGPDSGRICVDGDGNREEREPVV